MHGATVEIKVHVVCSLAEFVCAIFVIFLSTHLCALHFFFLMSRSYCSVPIMNCKYFAYLVLMWAVVVTLSHRYGGQYGQLRDFKCFYLSYIGK